MTPAAAAMAAFMVADREHQAELAGREYSFEDSRAVAMRCGVEATRLALVLRAEMQAQEASTLEASSVIKRMRGES